MSAKSTLESVSKETKAFKLLKIKNQCTTQEKKEEETIQLQRLQGENIAIYHWLWKISKCLAKCRSYLFPKLAH